MPWSSEFITCVMGGWYLFIRRDHHTKMLSRTLRKEDEKTKSMEESGEQCTVIFAKIVPEPVLHTHTQTHTHSLAGSVTINAKTTEYSPGSSMTNNNRSVHRRERVLLGQK